MKQESECTIKEASELLNIPASTLRYWEELGLIRAHRLPDSNYRTYSLHALFEASNIAFYRKMGVSIKQIEAMKLRSLEDVMETFDITINKLETEIDHMQQVLKRLKYQRTLGEHALDLIQNGVREGIPSIVRLNAYNAESQWQRKTLVRDMQRYALFIDINNPEEMVESYVDYPEGSDAEEDAKSQEDDAPVKVGVKSKQTKAGRAKKASDEDAALSALDEQKEASSVEAQQPCILWDRAQEIEKGVRFFEGVAFSEYEQRVCVQVGSLFEAAQKAGHKPLYAIAHFLVSADFDGRKDCYRVWIGCQ